MQEQEQEQWVPMTVAAEQLGKSKSKISRLATVGAIKTRQSLADRRIRLVNVKEIEKVLSEISG